MATSGAQRSGQGTGFTILELMVVVFIVGVLSAVAIPMFVNYQLRTKSAEAKTSLGSVRVLENAYYSEYDQFIAVAPEPPVIPGAIATAFDMSAGFAPLGFRPEGNVYFSYGVAVTPDGVGYTADAAADIDADGFVQFWGFAKPDAAGVLGPGQVGCDVTGLAPEQVGPCGPAHGNSIF